MNENITTVGRVKFRNCLYIYFSIFRLDTTRRNTILNDNFKEIHHY
jgi:hypothetical protein